MCKISNKLKLCTCSTKDATKLKNYWVLHRFVKGKMFDILGETMMPYQNSLVDEKLNKKTLLSLLNEGNVFDFDIELNDKDLLHLAFTFKGNHEEHNDYGFEYKNGKWRVSDYEAFVWMWRHEEYKYGKIKNGVQK